MPTPETPPATPPAPPLAPKAPTPVEPRLPELGRLPNTPAEAIYEVGQRFAAAHYAAHGISGGDAEQVAHNALTAARAFVATWLKAFATPSSSASSSATSTEVREDIHDEHPE